MSCKDCYWLGKQNSPCPSCGPTYSHYTFDRGESTGEMPNKEICRRLAAYEATGLTPEEIHELTHNSYGPLHKKLGEWIDAERDGRLHVMPCKIGSDVFALWGGKVVPGVVIGFHLHEWAEGCFVRVLFDTKKLNGTRDFSFDAFGKTLFFAQEEASAALKAGDGNA